jgi:hypothetical protein
MYRLLVVFLHSRSPLCFRRPHDKTFNHPAVPAYFSYEVIPDPMLRLNCLVDWTRPCWLACATIHLPTYKLLLGTVVPRMGRDLPHRCQRAIVRHVVDQHRAGHCHLDYPDPAACQVEDELEEKGRYRFDLSCGYIVSRSPAYIMPSSPSTKSHVADSVLLV